MKSNAFIAVLEIQKYRIHLMSAKGICIQITRDWVIIRVVDIDIDMDIDYRYTMNTTFINVQNK